MLEIYKSMESGPLQELSLKTLERGAWINIVDPTPYELKVVSNLTEVEPDFLRSALDDEERSHTDVEDNSVMILTNVPVVRESESYDTLPLAIILTEDYIITVCLEETPVMSEFNERTAKLFRTFKKTRFLFQILYKSATFYLRYLRQISKTSDEIEDRLRHSMKNSEILRLLELQKGLTYFNAALRSNGAVLEKLMRLRTTRTMQSILKIYEEDEDLLEDVIIENKQAREMVEMYSKILARLADTFSSIISNNQNMVMKFLAAMTIIIAIPTVVSSFFGMNVPMPFGMGDNANGFSYIMLIAGLFSCTAAYFFWSRHMF
ncbi:MAG: magnesium transporter CorA family protein [Selenomonadaceae bacterium]|nr:magnesium transporter CorA family protein [Selenomonadaceae bacterium]